MRKRQHLIILGVLVLFTLASSCGGAADIPLSSAPQSTTSGYADTDATSVRTELSGDASSSSAQDDQNSKTNSSSASSTSRAGGATAGSTRGSSKSTTKSSCTGSIISGNDSPGKGNTQTSAYIPPNPDEWQLFWSDEFNGDQLDTSKWSYERGFVRNKEPQAYTTRSKNVRFENGNLIMEAHKEVYNGVDAIINDWGNYPADQIGKPKTANYTSGSIITQGKFGVKYGKIEMRAKLPEGKAMWPAFWTMGPNPVVNGVTKYWPHCGEIDILEAYGGNLYKYESQLHWADASGQHASLWMPQYGGSTPSFQPGGAGVTIGKAYHIYGMMWDENFISFYCDDKIFSTINISDPAMSPEFHSNHYLLLNLALIQNVDALNQTVFPLTYAIDYVRVYKHI